jgi:long-subunit fatty acid transport protein
MLTNKELKAALLAGLVMMAAQTVSAQGLGNSPYSRLGIGEFNPNIGGVRQLGMGGTGLAAPNGVNVNELNPAVLYYTSRTTFEAGFNGQYKTVKNATNATRSGSGTLGYMALSVPLSSKWGAAVGLKPLSAVDYESNTAQRVTGDNDAFILKQFRGTGGVAEAYLSQGVRIAKDLSLGATASYVFGTIDEIRGTALQTSTSAATTKVVDRDHTRYSDFLFRGGAHYRHTVATGLALNLAGVYTFQSRLNGTRSSTQEREDLNGALVAPPIETANAPGTTVLPALAQAGISLDNEKNWTVNLDVAHQRWSKFASFNTAGIPLNDTYRVALGGELSPDPGSVEHYFRRVTYRAGLSLAQMPYQPGGKVLYDRAVSWGFAFPLPSATPLEATTFSLAFIYGVRGNTDMLNSDTGSSNVQESYIRGQLGVTINNRWFIKRRLL